MQFPAKETFVCVIGEYDAITMVGVMPVEAVYMKLQELPIRLLACMDFESGIATRGGLDFPWVGSEFLLV
jgi:hypothetical protein